MRASSLQKYILLQGLNQKGKFSRNILVKFYNNYKRKPKEADITNIITKSLERLIGKGLLTGYGVRTKEKWFIKEIFLTPLGRKSAKKFLGVQKKLPLKLSSNIKFYDHPQKHS
ncbi:MAG: hypothetical protein PHD51_02790 [Patescibacteria group bacterium]|nr:hypothetical protein [Patescibacteria group bacterium]MDD5490218.1 hypothetical protein [Patescibacteria group bacterium]